MGLDPVTLGLAMGGASLASSLMSGVSGANRTKAQAQAQQAQAGQLRGQARLAEQQGQLEAEAIDRQRSSLRRQYEEMQGANRAALGAGNVDLASGSALQVADGNSLAFASDMGESAYQRAIRNTETRNNTAALNHQANWLDESASWQKKQASNFAPTLLGAILPATGSFMTGYSFGGRLGGKRK